MAESAIFRVISPDGKDSFDALYYRLEGKHGAIHMKNGYYPMTDEMRDKVKDLFKSVGLELSNHGEGR
jgi:hypothetical protein